MVRALPFLALACLAGAARSQTFPAEEVDAFVLEQMEQQEVAGMSIAINVGGRLAYSKGYGLADVRGNRATTAKTKFEMGSLSDLFLAMTALKLAEQQKLSLDASVSGLLPEAPATWKGVLLRHTLAHTSGLADVLESEAIDPLGPATPAGLLKAATAMPPKSEPGSVWEYSGTNPLIAAAVIGQVGGKPWHEQADALFWKPTGMTSTALVRADDPHLAVGYSHSDAGWVKSEASSLALRTALGGGIASTVEDWARFDLAYGRETLLSKASWTSLKGPEPVKKGGNTRGFTMESGKLEDGTSWVGCMGFGDGFSGQYMRFEGLRTSVIVFCNTEGVDGQQIAEGIVEILQAASTDEG